MCYEGGIFNGSGYQQLWMLEAKLGELAEEERIDGKSKVASTMRIGVATPNFNTVFNP